MSSKKRNLTISEQKELEKLKRIINDSADATEVLVKSAKDKSRQALAEALTCGKALIQARKIIGYGRFRDWCSKNCRKSQMTLWKYMELVNRGLHLPATDLGLRQAYVSLGIIKEDVVEPSGTSEGDETGAHPTETVVLSCPPKISNKATPIANRMAKATGRSTITQVTPSITKEDVLSRARFLTTELLGELNSKITIKGVSKKDLEGVTLKPIADWFGAN